MVQHGIYAPENRAQVSRKAQEKEKMHPDLVCLQM